MSYCIEWEGALSKGGYGVTWYEGKQEYAHRAAWMKANGRRIPEGMCACHTCDNRSCVNPEHLFLGTRGDNNRDMVKKGRHWEQAKTHCPAGHPLSGDNLVPYWLKIGVRSCLICVRLQTRNAQRRYMAKKKLEEDH